MAASAESRPSVPADAAPLAGQRSPRADSRLLLEALEPVVEALLVVLDSVSGAGQDDVVLVVRALELDRRQPELLPLFAAEGGVERGGVVSPLQVHVGRLVPADGRLGDLDRLVGRLTARGGKLVLPA